MEAEATSPSNPQDDDEALRRRLLKRVAIAAGLIVLLLGGLVLFDSLYVRQETESAPQVASVGTLAPEPVTEQKAVVDEPPAEEVAKEPEAEPKVEAEPPAEPELTSAPDMVPAKPKVERVPTVPARAQPATLRAATPPAAQKSPPGSAVPSLATTPTPRPLANAMESVHRFLVQVGVFNNTHNAEELRAKLDAAGLPTQIEARVQVGPFASRHEADMAREKLKALGVDSSVLIAAKNKEKP